MDGSSPFFLVGPTAVGKTDLSLELAGALGAEIVGADSMQIYAGMPLLSGAPDPAQLRRVPHHLIGVIPPETEFNVALYLSLARETIERIHRRGRRALVVGGAGLYVRALTHGLLPLPSPDPDLRRELSACSLDELCRRLHALDPAAHARVDRANPRRVIRAIEIALLGTPPHGAGTGGRWHDAPPTRPLGIQLLRARAELRSRIDRRVDAMFDAGLIDEVRALLARRLSRTSSAALGIAQVRDHLEGRIDLDRCRADLQKATRSYAKRQLTWFRRERSFVTLDLSALDDPAHEIPATLALARLILEERAPGIGPAVPS